MKIHQSAMSENDHFTHTHTHTCTHTKPHNRWTHCFCLHENQAYRKQHAIKGQVDTWSTENKNFTVTGNLPYLSWIGFHRQSSPHQKNQYPLYLPFICLHKSLYKYSLCPFCCCCWFVGLLLQNRPVLPHKGTHCSVVLHVRHLLVTLCAPWSFFV